MKYFDEVNKIWSGKPAEQVFNPNVSLGQVILWSLQRNPNKIGQVGNQSWLASFLTHSGRFQISDDTGARVTNGELRSKAIRAADNLNKLGYAAGDVLGFVTGNNEHVAPVVFAALTLGCPVNGLDTSFDRSECH